MNFISVPRHVWMSRNVTRQIDQDVLSGRAGSNHNNVHNIKLVQTRFLDISSDNVIIV